GIADVEVIPLAAATGANVTAAARDAMPWYAGPTVLGHLESVVVAPRGARLPARLPVQLVLRDGEGGRWLAGTLASGALRTGDALRIEPDGVAATVAALMRSGQPVGQVVAGDAVAVRLAEDVDAARGDVLAAADAALATTDQFVAELLWFDEAALLPGRRYQLQAGTCVVGARVGEIRHLLDPETLQPLAAKRRQANDIGEVAVALDAPIPYAPYASEPALGSFVLLDMLSRATVAAGMVRHGLR